MRDQLEGCRGFNGPFPLPLWMSGMAPGGPGAFVGTGFVGTSVNIEVDPDIRRPYALFKTVTEGPDG